MYVTQAKGVPKIPEKAPEAPKSVGLKMEKGEDAPNFENMIYESNVVRQAEIEREKSEAGGDFRLGETKNDREFRKQLEKVTGKKQDLAKNKLERDDYLNLLVTQLKYQDPSKPMEHYEMASQMAQFNTVEQLMGVNKVLTEMKKLQNDAKAEKLSQYLGKDIEIQGSNIKLSGDSKANLAKFELPSAASNVLVEIRDQHSKVVKTIPMGALQPGGHKLSWDGTNEKGVKLPNGNYTFNILASTEDGKPMTAKLSYIAKVDGITDILSGGKLDTDVGPADPAKIIAIRNPEPQAPVETAKVQKNQIVAQTPNKSAVVADAAASNSSAEDFKANHLAALGTQNEEKNSSKNVSVPNNKVAEVKPNPNEVFAEPKLPYSEYKAQNKVAEQKEATKASPPAHASKPKSFENYQEPKPTPKYGGGPTVNGIHGR